MIHLDKWVGLPLCVLAFVLHQLGRPVAAWRGRRAERPVRRVLVVKFLGMGSILLATPLLRRLRETHPHARVTFLSFADNAQLLESLPLVDEVLVVSRRSVAGLLLEVPALLARLRARRFDVAVDLEFYSRLSNLVSWGSGARRRVGFFVRDRWRGSLLSDPVYFNPTLPYARAVLALLRPLVDAPRGADLATRPGECLEPPRVSGPARRAAHMRLRELGVDPDETILVVNANASDLCDERRWPAERFAQLVERFDDEVAAIDRIAFIGTARETPTVRAVLETVHPRARARCLDLSGRTSLTELIALLGAAALLVTNDSGPLHLAAALGVPTVSLFGPETPALYGPVGRDHLVFYAGHWCSPCLSVYNAKIAMCAGDNVCMRRIAVDDVVSATATFCRERVGLAPPRAGREGRTAAGAGTDGVPDGGPAP